MGNGNSNGQRMAISAMADMMAMTKGQLINIRDICLNLHTQTNQNNNNTKDRVPTLSREKLREAMNGIHLEVNDRDVLEQLFTMWDKFGDNKVNLLIFFASVSPLASTMDAETRLLFAFQVFDAESSGRMKKSDALKILNGINTTASYFGDAVLNTQLIDIIVNDIYKDQSEIYYEEYMDLFASHPGVVQFVNAGGTMKHNG